MNGFPNYMYGGYNPLTLPLTNILYPKVCLLVVCQDFAWQHILL